MGTVVSLGFCTKPDGLLPSLSTYKQATLIFSMAWSLDAFRFRIDASDRGRVEPRLMVSSTHPLEAVPATIERMRAGLAGQVRIHADPAMPCATDHTLQA